MTYYAIRYVEGAPVTPRPHAPTVGRWDTREAAEAALADAEFANADVLEVVERQEVA